MKGRRSRAIVALLVVIALSGCAPDRWDGYRPGFSELPDRCSVALAPADEAIRAFAGEASGLAVDSSDADREVADISQSLTCERKFGRSVPREPVASHRTPMWRNVKVSYYLSLYPIRVGEAPPNLTNYVPGSTQADSPVVTAVSGIGQNAIVWTREKNDAPPRIAVKFSIDNVIVTVETWGKDWSGVPETAPVSDSPDLRDDLREGAESIAKAIAAHIPSALPTAMLTLPSPTDRTSAPPSTEPEPQLWEPCWIPEDALSAAGLDPGTRISGDPNSSIALCAWQGGWMRLRVSYSLAPFEWSVYRSGSTYVRPKPVSIGDRHAVRVHWATSDRFCVLAFEVPLEANRRDEGGRTLTFEGAAYEDVSQTRLCDELIRVTTALSAYLPPTS